MSISTEITRLETAKADIKSAIENKGVTVGDGTIDTYAEKICEISGGSGTNPLNYAVTTPTFTMADFTDNPNLVLEVPNFDGKSINNILYGTQNLHSVKLICNVRNEPMTASYSFYNSNMLKSIDLSQFNTLISITTYMFRACSNLERIIGVLDFSNATAFNGTFYNCNKLEEITVAEKCINKNIDFSACSLLNDTSIQSIIDGLADLTGGTTQTITFHATVGGNLTEEQKATITAKNWELVY